MDMIQALYFPVTLVTEVTDVFIVTAVILVNLGY
jgi:hypothetical protein